MSARRKVDIYAAAFRRNERFDADESAVLARQLESIEKVVSQVRYPDLKALQFVPLIPGIDPGAETYTWRLQDKVGVADRMELRDWKSRRTPWTKRILSYVALALIPIVIFGLMVFIARHA